MTLADSCDPPQTAPMRRRVAHQLLSSIIHPNRKVVHHFLQKLSTKHPCFCMSHNQQQEASP